MTFDYKIYVDIEYGNRKIRDVFFISENVILDVIFGHNLINKLCGVELDKKFLIECPIDTKESTIVSWS